MQKIGGYNQGLKIGGKVISGSLSAYLLGQADAAPLRGKDLIICGVEVLAGN